MIKPNRKTLILTKNVFYKKYNFIFTKYPVREKKVNFSSPGLILEFFSFLTGAEIRRVNPGIGKIFEHHSKTKPYQNIQQTMTVQPRDVTWEQVNNAKTTLCSIGTFNNKQLYSS